MEPTWASMNPPPIHGQRLDLGERGLGLADDGVEPGPIVMIHPCSGQTQHKATVSRLQKDEAFLVITGVVAGIAGSVSVKGAIVAVIADIGRDWLQLAGVAIPRSQTV